MNETKVSVFATTDSEGVQLVGQFVDGIRRYDHITVYLSVAAGTGGTTDVTLQVSPDGTRWYDWARTPDIPAGTTHHYKICGALDNKVVEVGAGNVPVIAKGTVTAGAFGNYMRALVTRGAGSNGAGSVTCVLEGTFEKNR